MFRPGCRWEARPRRSVSGSRRHRAGAGEPHAWARRMRIGRRLRTWRSQDRYVPSTQCSFYFFSGSGLCVRLRNAQHWGERQCALTVLPHPCQRRSRTTPCIQFSPSRALRTWRPTWTSLTSRGFSREKVRTSFFTATTLYNRRTFAVVQRAAKFKNVW